MLFRNRRREGAFPARQRTGTERMTDQRRTLGATGDGASSIAHHFQRAHCHRPRRKEIEMDGWRDVTRTTGWLSVRAACVSMLGLVTRGKKLFVPLKTRLDSFSVLRHERRRKHAGLSFLFLSLSLSLSPVPVQWRMSTSSMARLPSSRWNVMTFPEERFPLITWPLAVPPSYVLSPVARLTNREQIPSLGLCRHYLHLSSGWSRPSVRREEVFSSGPRHDSPGRPYWHQIFSIKKWRQYSRSWIKKIQYPREPKHHQTWCFLCEKRQKNGISSDGTEKNIDVFWFHQSHSMILMKSK